MKRPLARQVGAPYLKFVCVCVCVCLCVCVSHYRCCMSASILRLSSHRPRPAQSSPPRHAPARLRHPSSPHRPRPARHTLPHHAAESASMTTQQTAHPHRTSPHTQPTCHTHSPPTSPPTSQGLSPAPRSSTPRVKPRGGRLCVAMARASVRRAGGASRGLRHGQNWRRS